VQQERHTHDGAMQQRLLAELVAHGDLAADLHGVSKGDQEALRVEAMRKIVEAEKMEEKRRRKAAKIAYMVGTTVVSCAKLIIFA
jgi:DNA topoisomerase 2-associated protein PAT1